MSLSTSEGEMGPHSIIIAQSNISIRPERNMGELTGVIIVQYVGPTFESQAGKMFLFWECCLLDKEREECMKPLGAREVDTEEGSACGIFARVARSAMTMLDSPASTSSRATSQKRNLGYGGISWVPYYMWFSGVPRRQGVFAGLF